MGRKIELTKDEIKELQKEYRLLWEKSITKELPEHVRRIYMNRRDGFVSCLHILRLCNQIGIDDINIEYMYKNNK